MFNAFDRFLDKIFGFGDPKPSKPSEIEAMFTDAYLEQKQDLDPPPLTYEMRNLKRRRDAQASTSSRSSSYSVTGPDTSANTAYFVNHDTPRHHSHDSSSSYSSYDSSSDSSSSSDSGGSCGGSD